ncbi:hypothetical protein SUGI_0859480 [Cryptomeria japonica]|nr:hypothetical protein SUGI_0859480 [Cryptomeria japonica]
MPVLNAACGPSESNKGRSAPVPKRTITLRIPVPAPTKEPITPTQGIAVPAPTKGEIAINWTSMPPTDGRDRPNMLAKTPNVLKKNILIVAVSAVAAAVVLAIVFMSYKKIYKPEPKQEGTATSLPSADVIIEGKAGAQQMQVYLGLSSNVQVVLIIAEAETGRIVEMHAGLSSNQQLFLEPTEIYTNLSLDDILHILKAIAVSLL